MLEVLRYSITFGNRPLRAAGKHVVHFGVAQADPASTADACRRAPRQLVRQVGLHGLNIFARQSSVQQPHATGNIETDTAGGDDAAVVRIEGGHAADRETIAPVRIGHHHSGLHDARQCADVTDLLPDLVVHFLDQLAIGVDERRHSHLAGRRYAPAGLV